MSNPEHLRLVRERGARRPDDGGPASVQLVRRTRAMTPAQLDAKPNGHGPLAVPCVHLGEETGQSVECGSCGRSPDGTRAKTLLKLRACAVYGECLPRNLADGVRSCLGTRASGGGVAPCPAYTRPIPPEPPPPSPQDRPRASVRWAYGVTTVRQRFGGLLPRTLASLAAAGFDRPHLFVDADADGRKYADRFHLTVTARGARPDGRGARTFGNWILSLLELFVRDPAADRYAIFQDDAVFVRGLRAYLDGQAMPERGYWNLYTWGSNHLRRPHKDRPSGWYPSSQRGRGALAMAFSRAGVIALMSSPIIQHKPLEVGWRSFKNVDGGVSEAMRTSDWTEYVHDPSLCQHTGDVSTMGNLPHPPSPSFPPEGDVDIREIMGWAAATASR